ncbi:hypothetical protein CLOM_g16449 [Closterium sp. NIES-68]|nr:hypothetical protein CLOM_g16449 [Closterium sp. NIES-68]
MPSAGRPRLVTERVRRGIVRSITLEEAEISAHVAKIVEKQHGITRVVAGAHVAAAPTLREGVEVAFVGAAEPAAVVAGSRVATVVVVEAVVAHLVAV